MNTALLDTEVDHRAELHAVINGLHNAPVVQTRHARQVAGIDRAIHRLTACKMKVIASADKAEVATDSGFADTNAWAARQTRTTRATAARGRARRRP